jgi:DNA replication protein DnaC
MLTEAVRQEIPTHTFLDLLLQAELSGREGRRVKTSLKLSNLPVCQTLENFDFAFQPAIERSRIDTLATCAWVRNAETVLIQGPPGVGKTHLLVGLGIRAVEQNFSVQYFRFDELMTALKEDAALPPIRLKRRKYMSTALLLIDELGFDPMTRQEASLFFRLVSYRYGRGAIMITTNTRACATGPNSSPATRCSPPRSSTDFSTAPMSSTSRAAATACATSRKR